jgi:hypothetical protein
MRSLRPFVLAALAMLAGGPAVQARVTVQFDYTYDDAGFFMAHPERRAVLEFAADYVTRFSDNLEPIIATGISFWDAQFFAPSHGAVEQIRNLEIPADTLVVYVGARNLFTAELGEAAPGWYVNSPYGTPDWIDTVKSRGEPGALETPWPSDFGPWGGSITFDDETDTSWYFGLDPDGLGADQYDFLSVAIHELAHVLGVGTSDSWDGLWQYDGLFYGDAAMAEHGGPVPLDFGTAHWEDGTMSVVDGHDQQAAMTPYLGAGERQLFTDLDFAGLNDVGWDTTPQANTWQGPAGDWDADSRWDTGLAPCCSHTAVFETGGGNPVIGTDAVVGGLDLRTAGWTLGGSGSLTLAFGGLQSAGSGWNDVNVPLTLLAGTTCTVETGNTLALAWALDAGGCALTKDGPGTLRLPGMTNLGRLDVQAGTVCLTGGGTLALPGGAFAMAAGGTLDLTTGNLVVDYDAAGPNPYDDVEAWVASGYNGGGWNGAGIASSTAAGDGLPTALAVADNVGLGLASLEGEPLDGTEVLVKFTWAGDANLDGAVTGLDVNQLIVSFSTPPADPRWVDADFNYDGAITALDVNELIQGYNGQGTPLGDGPAAPGGIPTPEPATLALAAAGAAVLLARRRHR